MTHLAQALALYEAGNYADALPAFRLAVKDDPLNPQVWYHAAVTAMELRDYRFAISLLEAYTRFVPGDAKALRNLAHALFAVGDYAASFAAYDRAATAQPDSIKAQLALGHLSRMLGRPDDAPRHYDRVLASSSPKPADQRDRALLRLALGDHERGWREFEGRLLIPPPNPFDARWRPSAEQRWDGERAPGRAVCLYNLRGHGDTILFARYAARAAERAGAAVTLMVQPTLRSLVAPVPGVGAVVESAADLPPDTRYADMWSLPSLLGADLLAGASPRRYLWPSNPPPAVPAAPAGDRALRVGLAWAGHPDTLHDPDRSVPDVRLLAPLLATPGVAWRSLQVGHRADEAGALGLPPAGSTGDFDATARVIAGLDLVVTVDTAVANLTGALGLEGWVLPPTYPEPRWGLDGERTSWYPTLRLFRRRHTTGWSEAIERLAAALAERAAGRGA